jgi:4-amino-4-deoxy-L-arabinose transferase-like glycosyltransferase
MRAGGAVARRWGGVLSRADLLTLGALLAVAAVLRFVDLATRGTWDADQGHDMLVLARLVGAGDWPLLGPPTSIGAVHHGAGYYYLLAPAAWIGGGDPTVVVAAIALLGTAAVALVWWVARHVGGPVAGLAAGLMAAVSASAIEESTFIWNPNLIAFSSALTMAAAWRAWTSRRSGWWLLAAVGQAITMQCHVLGAVLLPPLAVLLIADARRSGSGGREAEGRRRGVMVVGLAAVVIIAVSYLPLAIHELGHDFSETRAAVAFLSGGGGHTTLDPVARLLVVGLRILAWPLAGLLTDSPVVSVAAATAVVAALAWRLRAASGLERSFARWVALAIAWCWAVLGLGVAGLATVTPLPVDHYHAFLDPLVFVVAGLGVGALWRSRPGAGGSVLAVVIVTALVASNVPRWPAAVSPDGGWPAARAAATRVEAAAGTGSIALLSLPSFKTAEAYAFPLQRDGRTLVTPADAADSLVVVCDALFVSGCGGPAETAALVALGSGWSAAASPADRFEAAPGRTISVYRRGGTFVDRARYPRSGRT